MRTALYYEYARNKKSFLQNMVIWVILFLVLFLVSLILERVLPKFSSTYLKWPDMIQNFLGIGNWNRHIYVNLWQMMALFFPIYMAYILMNGLAGSLVKEERLETIVYLQNLSVSRSGLMFAKLLFWIGYAFVTMVVLLIVNIVLFVLLENTMLISMLAEYYSIMFYSCLIYLALALFLSSYSHDENACDELITGVLFVTVLFARMGAFIQFLADLMVMRGHEGEIIGKLTLVANQLNVLGVLCPATWCWQGVIVTDLFLVCGGIMAVILVVGAFWIYSYPKKGLRR